MRILSLIRALVRRDNFEYSRRSPITNVYIDSEKLTPIGQLNGTLGSLSVVELGSAVISDLINDIDPSVFDEVIIGQVLSGGAGKNSARQRH